MDKIHSNDHSSKTERHTCRPKIHAWIKNYLNSMPTFSFPKIIKFWNYKYQSDREELYTKFNSFSNCDTVLGCTHNSYINETRSLRLVLMSKIQGRKISKKYRERIRMCFLGNLKLKLKNSLVIYSSVPEFLYTTACELTVLVRELFKSSDRSSNACRRCTLKTLEIIFGESAICKNCPFIWESYSKL